MKILGEILNVETVAEGHGIRERKQLRQRYGYGNWRKMKGIAIVELPDGYTGRVEVHWYEAHGISTTLVNVILNYLSNAFCDATNTHDGFDAEPREFDQAKNLWFVSLSAIKV